MLTHKTNCGVGRVCHDEKFPCWEPIASGDGDLETHGGAEQCRPGEKFPGGLESRTLATPSVAQASRGHLVNLLGNSLATERGSTWLKQCHIACGNGLEDC